MKYFFPSFVIVLALSGCVIQKRIEAQNNTDVSYKAYRECLLKNKVSMCESQKSLYQADVDRYNSLAQPIIPEEQTGSSGTDYSQPQSQTWMVNQNGRSYLCNNIGGTVNCN